MTTVTIHQAKTHLSRLLKAVSNGEEVIIKKFNTPIARLMPLAQKTIRRKPGSMKGQISYDQSFETGTEAVDIFNNSVIFPQS